MQKRALISMSLAALVCTPLPGAAQDIDSLKGQFTFNWHTNPSKVRCLPVDQKLVALFKSAAFECKPEIVTNTASGQPARVCAKRAGGVEYLVFRTKKMCEEERLTQVSNSDG